MVRSLPDYRAVIEKHLDSATTRSLVRSNCLSDIVEDDLFRLTEIVNDLGKSSPLYKPFKSVRKRLEIATKTPADGEQEADVHRLWRKAMHQLPLALGMLSSAAKQLKHEKKTEVIAVIDSLVEKALGHLVALAARRLPAKLQPPSMSQGQAFELIGQGAGYWALADADRTVVALVSKADDNKQFEQLKERWTMAQAISEKGQPHAHLIASMPFLHAFFDYARGERVGDLYQAAAGAAPSDPKVTRVKEALRGVGQALRSIADIQVTGCGGIQRSNPSEPRSALCGKSPNPDRFFAGQQRLLNNILTSPEKPELLEKKLTIAPKTITYVNTWFKQYFLDTSALRLAHTDPHLRNFVYDSSSRGVAILDWERAQVLPEAVMLGRLYHCNTYCDNQGALCEDLFRDILSGYEPDETKQNNLLVMARRAATVHQYTYVCLKMFHTVFRTPRDKQSVERYARRIVAAVKLETPDS